MAEKIRQYVAIDANNAEEKEMPISFGSTVACRAEICCMRMSTTSFGTISCATLLTALPASFLHL